MTTLLLIFGVGLVVATAMLLARAATLPRLRQMLHLRQIAHYGFHDQVGVDVGLAPAGSPGPLSASVEAIGRLISAALPSLPPLTSGELAAAGIYTRSPEYVHGARTLLALLLPALFILTGFSFSLTDVVLVVGGFVAGWELPAMAIRQRGRYRLDAIDRELPRLIDVMIATIEGGLGFAASLQMISERFKGPMGAELKLMQREQSLGITTEQALENLLTRADTPSVRAFARSLIHGQQLGVSIGPMLRNLATDIRRRRRQDAREKVQKAPLKMLFPLAILIFPPLLVVIMYPAAYSIIHTL
jgi:Flp pilus assembly protein TadB